MAVWLHNVEWDFFLIKLSSVDSHKISLLTLLTSHGGDEWKLLIFCFSTFVHSMFKICHMNDTTKVRLRTVINAGHCSVQRIKCKHFGHVTLADVGSGQISSNMEKNFYVRKNLYRAHLTCTWLVLVSTSSRSAQFLEALLPVALLDSHKIDCCTS